MANRGNPTIILTSFFYLGYLPLMPGTFASLSGLFIFLGLHPYGLIYKLVTLAVLLLGFLLAGRAEIVLGERDCRHIVIDEVAGMLLSLFFLPYDLRLAFLAFLLFRIFDTLKPFPCSLLERLRGSYGIMGDDIIAALYTTIVLQAALRLAVFRIS